MTADLLDFLRARLDARERHIEFVRDWIPETHQGEFIDPVYELREVEAKRRILDEHLESTLGDTGLSAGDCASCMNEAWPCPTLRLLALPDVDHPDYRPDWRP